MKKDEELVESGKVNRQPYWDQRKGRMKIIE